ncbi:MAG: ABC transporter ATP-binding protein [Pseudomonadota bacterium]|nr:ABC transporter ATP-binding protein [Pseudomonadota bacterium]
MPDRGARAGRAGEAAISIQGVEKSFGALRALKGVDLQVEQGEFFALLGPNGAGKTTLISLLAGLSRPDAGRLAILGHDTGSDYRAARRLVGIVPQELVFDPFFTVRETLRIQSGYFGIPPDRAWIDELLENLQLTDKADANMRSLSGGMKRRVLVAQALVHRPPVLVLDEPTAGVDVELRQTLWKFIRRLNGEGHTILLTTHYLEEAQALCNRVAMMKEGRIVALDTTRNLLAAHSHPSLSFGVAGDLPLPPALAARAQALPGGRHRLALGDFAEVEQVLAACRQAGLQVEDLEVGQADLEEVFVAIVSGAAQGRIPS